MSKDPVLPESSSVSRRRTLAGLLESGDGLAHLLVAALLLILAIAVLFNSTYSFVADIVRGTVVGSFTERSLSFLSDILFGVIILELLSTILTYIHARNLEATIKDFLVVGLISSVRKILLVGAQSSLAESAHKEADPYAFIREATGTVITVVGILMLIGGLIWLEQRRLANLHNASEVEH